MPAAKIVGLILVVIGIVSLIWGGFTYTRDRHDVDIGPLQFAVEERETVNIPLWAGIGALVIGGVLLLRRS
jgi:TRAP-type C4-dicarboxylate transport system permease small subunit